MKQFLLACSLLAGLKSIGQTTDTLPFTWTGNHSALLLPVKITGYSGTYFMQFDLGSPYTLFYKNALPAFSDTLHNYSFHIHNKKYTLASIPVKEVSSNEKIIGTIGSDLITDKIALFDYPANRLLLTDHIPAKYTGTAAWQPFYFAGGRVLLPAVINNQKTVLYFDTGSSDFALLTDSATAIRLSTPGSAGRHYPVNSWGRTVTAHTYPSADSVQIGGASLPLQQVSWISGASETQVQQMKQFGIGGMTGNRLFLQHILILDTKRKLFVVVDGER